MPIVVLILIALLVLLASRGEERPPTLPPEKPLELPPPSKEDVSRFWNRVKDYWGHIRKYNREAGVDRISYAVWCCGIQRRSWKCK